MRLLQLNAQDFRNIEQVSLRFEGQRIFFVGRNGQGKTNLLEAIGLLSTLRSFRTSEPRSLIRHQAPRAGLFYRLDHPQLRETEITLGISEKGKQLRMDGQAVPKLGEHIGHFPTVVMAADDIQLIRGGPAQRRAYLDEVFASVDPHYYATLARFKRAIKDRNRLLKLPYADTTQLDAFDCVLAQSAAELTALRRRYTQLLGKRVEASYTQVAAGNEAAGLVYEAHTAANSEDAFLEALRQQRERDLSLGSTQIGPHRDELALHIGGHPAREYGSEGQQRSLTLALRFAQIHFCREKTGLSPIILADDVLGELDSQRRAAFWQTVSDAHQLFATGTTLPDGADKGGWQIWQVEAGCFQLRKKACH